GRTPAGPLLRPLTHRPTERVRRTFELLADAPPARLGGVDGAGEQRTGQVVLTLRKADLDLALGAPVELRRAPGPRAAATGQPLELELEQPLLGQLVEVE